MNAAEKVLLDVRGVCCPLPLIQVAKMVKDLKPGQTLEVKGNDPIFESSMRDFCQAHGHTVLAVTADGASSVCMLIQVKGGT